MPEEIDKVPEDQLLALPEAALLAWPDGSKKTSYLLQAIEEGRLKAAERGGRLYVTLAAVKELEEPQATAKEEDAAETKEPARKKLGFGKKG
ncbi:hypothetical protein [Sinorhizobium fredii]|uniref:hypothetical protein n=1 Tax=Rhizobium fredii TaxID=380 RepID=UPI00129794AE|nr:hypothetical protein [Sinorhizobium fredii]MQW94110.1 hypothetical protein [Sinorhizobium fredii]